MLWVGKMDFRKQLNLAIRTLADLRKEDVRLHIVGSGDAKAYKDLAQRLGVAHQCLWYGAVSHEKVQKMMQEADIFFFTSVAEGTPHVVLEAIGNALPVVCFNVCGQGDSVNEKVGAKISLSTPKQSVTDFAKKIDYLYTHRDTLQSLSEGCKERQQELSWENKALQVVSLYNQIIQK